MMYLAMVLLVTANKIASYKSVYIFTSKSCSVCLVFMYTYWFSGYSFKQVMEIIWESTCLHAYQLLFFVNQLSVYQHISTLHPSYTLLSSLLYIS